MKVYQSKMFVYRAILLVLVVSPFFCDAKRTRIHHLKGSLVKVKPDTLEKAYRKDHLGKTFKKQGLEVPYDEALGGEPVGDINSKAGLDGLGGDMHGYPTGMGAGGEPLGAYEQKENPMQAGMQQGLNEGPNGYGDQPPFGFSRNPPPNAFTQGSDSQQGDFFEGRNNMDMVGPQNFRPGGPGEQSEQFIPPQSQNEEAAQNVLGPQQQQGFLNPPPAMGESMSNDLEAMDKANVQGDREVGDMVRARDQQNSMDQPSVPNTSDAAFMQQGQSPFGNNLQSNEFRNFKKSYYGLENGLHAKVPEELDNHMTKNKKEESHEKDEVNFWKKNGDVQFDDISDIEERLDKDNYNTINRYKEEDMQKFKDNKFFDDKFNTKHNKNIQSQLHVPSWGQMSKGHSNAFNRGVNSYIRPYLNKDYSSYTYRNQPVMSFIGKPSSNKELSFGMDSAKDTVDNAVPRDTHMNGGYEMTAYSSSMMNMAQIALEKRKRKRTSIVNKKINNKQL